MNIKPRQGIFLVMLTVKYGIPEDVDIAGGNVASQPFTPCPAAPETKFE